MERGGAGSKPGRERLWILAPAVLYVLLGAPFAWNYRNHFTSDSAVYMDMARLLAEGRFPEAFVGYWGPLFPGIVALALLLGAPVIAAAKVLGFLTGLAWVLVFQRFLARRLPPRFAAVGAVVGGLPALLVVGVPFSILPDALLSIVVMILAAVLSSDGRRPGWKGSLLAGIACGLAYLCKTPAWILFVPPALASLAWSRWRTGGSWGGFLRRSAMAWTLLGAGFLAVAGPWIAGISLRVGTATLGSATDVMLVNNYVREGLPAPDVRFRIPYDGERWLQHNAWSREVEGPVPFHWGFHLGRILPNLRPFLLYSAACPLLLLGILALVRYPRRILSRPGLYPAAFLAVWGLPPLFLRYLEIRFLLYTSPLLVLLGLGLPLPAVLRRVGLGKRRLVLLAAVAAFALAVRYAPVRPLGTARMRGTAVVRTRLEGKERVGYNRMAAGIPVSFLLDRPLALKAFPDPGLRAAGTPDLVIWSEDPSDPGSRMPEGGLAGYAPLHDWFEEDGLHVRVLRAVP